MDLPARCRILAVDDEVAVLRLLATSLRAKGFDVETAASGAEGIKKLEQISPHAIILDLGLSDMEGLAALGFIRERSAAPVIVLTARDAEADKIALLEAGADDYLTKPFSLPELVARIHVVLRRVRSTVHAPALLHYAGFELRLAEKKASLAGQPLKLTGTEFAVLKELVEARGQVVLQKALLQNVWGGVGLENPHYLRIYVGMLRKKIERDAARPVVLLTEPGVGYRLAPSIDERAKPPSDKR